MADDSDTAFSFLNNPDKSNNKTSEIFVGDAESKSCFKKLIICTIFAFLTIVMVFVPGFSPCWDASLKTVFTLFSMIAGFNVYKKAASDVFKKKITAEVVLCSSVIVSFVFALLTGFQIFKKALLINSDFYFVVTVIDLWAMMIGIFHHGDEYYPMKL